MRKKQSILAVTKPLNVTPILALVDGTCPFTQVFDNSTGEYSPNRSINTTLVIPYVRVLNPNTGLTTDVYPTQVTVASEDGAPVNSFVVVAQGELTPGGTQVYQLRCTSNLTPEVGSRTFIVTMQFTNPTTGLSESVSEKMTFKTDVSSVTNLSLVPLLVDAGNGTFLPSTNDVVVNPLVNPLNAAASNWKFKIGVQLLDGSVPVAPYIHSGSAVPEGNAIFFWYRKHRNGKMELLQAGLPWTDAATNNTGVYPTEINVDLAQIEDVTLVCRAGYVPYGDIPSMEDEFGKVSPDLIRQGWLVQEFRLKVQMPTIDTVDIYKTSMPVIEVSQFNSQSAILRRRCVVKAGNMIVNDMSVTAPEQAETRLEKFYNITWYAVRNVVENNVSRRVETVIGHGEWLSITPYALGITSEETIPEFEVNVEPRVGVWNINGATYSRYKSDGSETVPVQKMGANDIANELANYLVNSSGSIVGRLRRNNIFRFDDGTPAPVIVVTAAKLAEITAAEGDTYYGLPKACFTTDLGYDIMYGWTEKVHTVELHTSGDEQICSFAHHAHTYGAAESREIVPTLISPGLPTVISGKFRHIFCLGRIGSAGNNGPGNLITYYNRNDRTYVASGLSQISVDNYAKAKNPDTSKTIPYAPLMDWYLLNILNANELKFGKACLIDENLFGGGISSDYSYDSSHAENRTGVKFSVNGGTPSYASLGSTPNICVDANGTKKSWNEMLSSQGPRMECAEIHAVLSWAVENEISPNTWFTCPLTGGYYKYTNIDGFDGILSYTDTASKLHTSVELSAKLFRKDTITFNAYNTSGTQISVTAEVMLQMSLVNGIDLCSCDVFQYSGAGIEQILTVDSNHAGGNGAGNPRDLYLCIDQEHLIITTDVLKTGGASFGCENSEYYEHLGQYALNSGYQQDLLRGTRFGARVIGGLQNIGGYKYNENYANTTLGAKNRMGLRGRGSGFYGISFPRYAHANNAASYAYAHTAGGFQVRLSQNP